MIDEPAIRPLRPADAPAVRFTFARLSPRSRRQRYLLVKPRLSDTELRRLTEVDHWHHEALIACSPVPRMPIGIARYVRAERFDVAEIAIEVVDAWQRRGVGRALTRELSRRATRAGIRCLRATLLWDNAGALRLLAELGRPRIRVGASGVMELEVEIGHNWRAYS